MENRSTLKPAQVAHIMVDNAVAKHRDRYENVFWKAVSDLQYFLSMRHWAHKPHCLSFPVCGGCYVILWEPPIGNYLRWFSCFEPIQSWPCQNPWRSGVPCWFDHVRARIMDFQVPVFDVEVTRIVLNGHELLTSNMLVSGIPGLI